MSVARCAAAGRVPSSEGLAGRRRLAARLPAAPQTTLPFWPADISLRDLLDPGKLITHAQVTDVYLLALAVKNGSMLASLDPRLPVDAVRGGRDAFELIVP